MQHFTEHLNAQDTTNSIQIMHEEKEDEAIASLDIKIHHIEDGSIKITV